MYKYIDLFCGAGGLSLGFNNAGFENIFSIDIEPSFCETYKANFPSHKLIQADIKTLTDDDIRAITKKQDIDVIIGGPPCQGFSIAGNIGRKFIDDSRNSLFREYARIVEIVQPKFFVMENVAKLYTHNKGKTKEDILEKFKSIGYTVDCMVFNTAEYGIPQVRNRILFIGSKISDKILFPVKNTKEYMSVREAIDHYPKLTSGGRSEIANHVAMKHSDQMLKKMNHITDGGNRLEIPKEIRPLTGDARKYIKYKSDEPSICITGDMRKVFHYSQNRALTVRELASIQTFPDDFVFKGSLISQQQQVGNAVPPKFATAIANVIIEQIIKDGQ